MYARIAQSRIDMAQLDDARKMLASEIVPRVRQLPGIVGGYWMEPVEGMGMSVLLFDSREAAEAPMPNAQPGESPAPGVVVERVEVREVVGQL